MANDFSVGLDEAEDEVLEAFDFDDEEDDFMERSQRKLLQAKRGKVSRRNSDWD